MIRTRDNPSVTVQGSNSAYCRTSRVSLRRSGFVVCSRLGSCSSQTFLTCVLYLTSFATYHLFLSHSILQSHTESAISAKRERLFCRLSGTVVAFSWCSSSLAAEDSRNSPRSVHRANLNRAMDTYSLGRFTLLYTASVTEHSSLATYTFECVTSYPSSSWGSLE